MQYYERGNSILVGNILDSMTEQYNKLTRSGKKLADYIFSNTAGAQYMSITSLAENCGVSEATITRFCRGLGLTGYNDLKLALAKADRTTDLGDPCGTPQTINLNDDLETLCRKLHTSNIISLNETLEYLDESALMAAIDILSYARNIYCFGQGGSMVTAMEAWARFSTVAPNFIHIADSHMQLMTTALLNSCDALLFFSYSGATTDMEDILQAAHNNGVKIILVTHFKKSAAAELADVVLLCGYNESPLQSGSIAAKIGQMFLIDCLFYGFCQKNPKLSAEARNTTSSALMKKLL